MVYIKGVGTAPGDLGIPRLEHSPSSYTYATLRSVQEEGHLPCGFWLDDVRRRLLRLRVPEAVFGAMHTLFLVVYCY